MPRLAWLGAAVLAIAACGGGGEAEPELTVRDAFMIPGTGALAIYVEVANDGGADKLLGASLPDHPGASVSLHRTGQDQNLAVMEPVLVIDIPAETPSALLPRDAHLMVDGLTEELQPGDRLTIRLRFHRAAEQDVEVEVVPVAEALERMDVVDPG